MIIIIWLRILFYWKRNFGSNKMNVYTVTEDFGDRPLETFSTRELAQEYINRLIEEDEDSVPDFYEIYELEVHTETFVT